MAAIRSLHRKDQIDLPAATVKENLDSVNMSHHNRLMKLAQKLREKPHKPLPRQVVSRVQSYHHGDLHDALLKAAEAVLERKGVQGLTLRAAAREAGVSHAAPAHHFGDLTGLLSELAAVGFRRFGAAMQVAASVAASRHDRLDAMGIAYVKFARTYPSLFMLMFRSERLDFARPALNQAMVAASAALAGAVGARRNDAAGTEPSMQKRAADMVRAWSIVHGFAVLLLDHRLDNLVAMFPGADPEALLGAVLRYQPPAGETR
jgi:AcrR family transcriptional regulator